MANNRTEKTVTPNGRTSGKCPICGKPSQDDHRPFCSAHCGYVDLNRWLGGRYAIPAVDDDPADEIETDPTGE